MYSIEAFSSSVSSPVDFLGRQIVNSPCHDEKHLLQKANPQSSHTASRSLPATNFLDLPSSASESSSELSSSSNPSGLRCFFDLAAP